MNLRERYEAGATIEELALDEGVSIATMRKRLVAEDTVMRRKGARTGSMQRDTRLRDGIPGKPNDQSDRGVVARGPKRVGKRHRGL